MTIEEKAKAYDEALDRMKYVVVVPKDKKALQALKETIFPELAESEDERIRKIIRLALIASEDELSDFYKVHNTSRKECTDWLEKQKEQEPISTEETELNSIAFLVQMGYTCIPPGAKPAEWSEEDEEMISNIISSLRGYMCLASKSPYYTNHEAHIQKEIEFLNTLPERLNLHPKQEWSEEDEKMVRFYEADYNNQIGDMPMKDVIDMRLKFKDWLINQLKSIRPQSKQEWSEEDWKLLDEMRDYLMSMCYSGDLSPNHIYEGFIDLIDRLKSLRPYWKPSEQEKGALRTAIHILTEERNFPKAAAQLQNILNAFEGEDSRKDWKPSEEQMEALSDAYVEASTFKKGDILESLYNDLRKLI